MTGIEHVPFLLDDLDEVEAVRSLDDLRDHTRLESHSGIRKGRPEDRLRSHSDFSTLVGVAPVFRIDSGERGKFLTVENSLAQTEEFLAHGKIGSLAVRIETDLAELVLFRNDRESGLVDRIHEGTHLQRSQFRKFSYNLHLLLLDEAHLLELLPEVLTETVDRLAEIGLQLLLSSQIEHHLADTRLDIALDHILVDSERIYPRLHQEKLVFHDGLKDVTTQMPVGSHALGSLVLDLRLYVGNHDGLVAHDCDSLVNNIVFLREGQHAAEKEHECYGCDSFHSE